MSNSLFSKNLSPQESTDENQTVTPWLVVIIDDEEDVHTITKLTIGSFQVDNRPIKFISAYSKAEGIKVFNEHQDIALAIVDVVMESDSAGLELIDYVRNTLENHKVRLVLRTGQSVKVPESDVISRYDINDYKDKTELTTQKLKTLFYATIRSYRDIITIERSKKSIHNVLKSTSNVLKSSTLSNFANAVLEQIVLLQGNKSHAVYASTFPNKKNHERQEYFVAATSKYRNESELNDYYSLPADIQQKFEASLSKKSSMRFKDGYVAYLKTSSGHQNVLAILSENEIEDADLEMLELYCSNVSLTYELLLKNEDMADVQRQLVLLLGEAVESRSKETGAHVKRVSLICKKLSLALGLSLEEAEIMRYASPLHDVGKIAIPDVILNKPGKLEGNDWEIMKSHAEIGAKILQKSPQKIFQVAADISLGHHEKWDGTGYPNGLSGEDIPLVARITTIADVFDALGSKRCYKDPWNNEDILAFIIEQKGRMFDPAIADILINDFDSFLEIRRQNPD